MSDGMSTLSRFNLDEWEKEAKEHADSEAFAKPLLGAIAEIRRLMDDNNRIGRERCDEQSKTARMDLVVFDPNLSDRSVRLLLANDAGVHGRTPHPDSIGRMWGGAR